jgi:hypothetical protein
MLIVCMPRIKLSYIRQECEHIKPMPLLYKLYYMIIIFTEKTISTLLSSSSRKLQPHRQLIGGQRKPLKEIFIVVVHLISIF